MLLEILMTLMVEQASRGGAFETPARDGVMIRGTVDQPDETNLGVAILVAGTGPFDRDARFFKPGEPQGPGLFLDLSRRLTARGLTVVRYDKRGVRFGLGPDDRIDRTEAVTATTETMRDDLGSLLDWARSQRGLNARCVVLVGHSEGMAHIGRLAASGAAPPTGVVGIGPLLTDPVSNFRWNFAERDAWSLRALDADDDGHTTNAEVEAGFARSPAAVNGIMAPYIHPDGAWSAEALTRLETAQSGVYDTFRATTLAQPDETPWPSADAPTSTFQWWKSWLSDDTPVAARLAAWPVPVRAHFGELDSQVHVPLQIKAAQDALGDQFSVVVHPNAGHSLGFDPTYGPMREDLADQVADDVRDALTTCAAVGTSD